MKQIGIALAAAFLATNVHAGWTYDATAKTLSNDDWSFANVTVKTVNGVTGLQIAGTPTQKGASTVIDFTDVEADTTYKVVSHQGDGNLRGICSVYVAPDVTDLGSMFYGASAKAPNSVLTSVTVSPDVKTLGTFKYCSTLEILKTTATVGDTVVFPCVTSVAKELFRENLALAGSYEFTVLTTLQGKMFMGTAVREVRFPVLTKFDAGYDYMFSGCKSLVTCYMPLVTTIGKAVETWNNCSELTTLTLAANVDFPEGIGTSAFNNCSKLTTLSNLTFPRATCVESSAFSNCGITGKLSLPAVTTIGSSAFLKSKFTEIYAPKAETIGPNNAQTFSTCSNLKKVTLGSMCATDGSAPAKGFLACNSESFDLFLTGSDVPTSFNGYWMQPNGTTLAKMKARIWMKTGVGSAWEAWKTVYSGTSGFVEAKDFDATYTSAATYPGADVTLGCLNNLSDGYAWICEWGTFDAVVTCPVGVQIAALRADGETVAPSQDGSYKILKTAVIDIDYETVDGYLFADGSSAATATGLAAAANYAANVCPKTAVACEAKADDVLYLTLQEALSAGGGVTLLKSVETTSALTVPAGKSVVLEIGSYSITAPGTVFDVAGSLMVNGDGVIHGTGFTGEGAVRLTGGTYDFDVGAFCVPGFLAEAQGTDPETWKVVQNTDVAKLNVNLSDLVAANVGEFAIDFVGLYTCVTNGDTISYDLPKNAPFSVVFTAAANCRFEGASKTSTTSFASGISSVTTLTAQDVPVAVACPVWSLDLTTNVKQAYLVSGNVRLKVTTTQVGKTTEYLHVVTKTSEAGDSYTGLEISGVDTLDGETVIDLSAVADGAGYDVISMKSSAFAGQAVVSVVAPHVVYLDYGSFNGCAALTSVTLSPNLYYIGGRAFMQTSALTDLQPHVFAKFETFNVSDRYNFKMSAVSGDYVFGRVKVLPEQCFQACTNLTSVRFPECERVVDSCFNGCSSLTNFCAPKAIDFKASALIACPKLATVEFSTAVTNIAGSAFYQDVIESLPEANWTNLLYLGGSNFAFSKAEMGDVNVPLLTTLAGRNFQNAKLTSCYAPLVETIGEYAFDYCSKMTNLTIRGSAGCFIANYAFRGADSLKDLNWLGDEAPTALKQYSLAGGASQSPVVVRVKTGKDLDGWRAICTKTKAEMEADEKAADYRLLARQTGIKWHRVVGFIGGTVSVTKEVASANNDANSNRCWIYDDSPKGFTVIVR